jgi:hypothetical protein
MTLADRIAQSRVPLLVQLLSSGSVTKLNGPAECAQQIKSCPLRFALSDDLTRLCTALAYSRGARTLDCADLLHAPAEWVWVEWCQQPWERELALYRFRMPDIGAAAGARRGALIRSSPEGRRGSLRTFWTTDRGESLASSMEAFFDFDTAPGEVPEPPDGEYSRTVQVTDGKTLAQDVLGRCFRFRYERSWREYYQQAALDTASEQTVTHHALGTIAIDIPVVLVFFLLLATRSGLPRHPQTFARLNRARLRRGKVPLLEHIEVSCPLLPSQQDAGPDGLRGSRRGPRLHHVRGHLFRRGCELYWRVPHLRGNARRGVVQTRTVTWTFEGSANARALPD